jgi:hypothetical protein
MERLLFRLHETESGPQLIGQLVILSTAIKQAIHSHPVEAVFLRKRFDEVDNLIMRCMASPVMDEYDKFISMMCLDPFMPSAIPDVTLIKRQKDSVVYQLTSEAKIHIFTRGPLRLCLEQDLSCLCGTVQVCLWGESGVCHVMYVDRHFR